MNIQNLTVEKRSDAGVEASRLFLALAIALIAVAFVMPIGAHWQRSVFEDYVDAATTEAGARDGNISRQVALLGLTLFGAASLAWPGGRRIRVDSTLALLCIVYVAWCAMTCWSAEDPSVSFKRWVVLICEGIAGLGIAKRASPRQFVWIVLACTLSWLGLGVLAELSHGTFRPWQGAYRFAGIFHPNEMAINCGVLTMAALYLAGGSRFHNRLLLAIAAVAVLFLVLTGSRTAAGAMVLSVAALWLLMTPTLTFVTRSTSLLTAAALCGMLYGLGFFGFSENLVSMGRLDNDVSSLTGRMPLWNELLGFVAQKPWTGHGYNAFWTSDRIAEISHSQQWSLSTAHNAYIELLLNVGWIGTISCLSAMVLALIRGARTEALEPKAGYGFIAMIMVFGLAAGLLESTIGITWYMSFMGICAMCYVAFYYEPLDQPESVNIEPLQFGMHAFVRR